VSAGSESYHGHAYDNIAGRPVVVLTSPSPAELLELQEAAAVAPRPDNAKVEEMEAYVASIQKLFEEAARDPNTPKDEICELDANVEVYAPDFHMGTSVRARARSYGVPWKRILRRIARVRCEREKRLSKEDAGAIIPPDTIPPLVCQRE